MNGDMPHVPITTLAGISSLTDLLNQLPLPSPLPATTTKSLLYNGRIAEEVSCLLACRDENLVSQLAHSLNQVSTEHIELKDNLGSDEPEGDVPALLQTVLSRNPGIFREKNVMQQAMVQQYKSIQNSMHGSPAQSATFQQASMSPSPSSRGFVSPQASSGSRFIAQQNSPVPSPYTPQSPAGFMQYPHPPSYSQHQQIQQVSVASPMVPGGMRNIHESKGQMSNAANHHPDRHGSDDYMSIVHRLGNESDPSLRNASFPLRSPQPGCSPAGSEGTPKAGSRPPLSLPSPPPYASPPDGPPDLLLDSPDQRKKLQQQKKKLGSKEDKDSHDIVTSPPKDATRLTLKLSRVKSEEDASGELPPGTVNQSSDLGGEPGHRQVPALQNMGAAKGQGGPHSSPYDAAELDALAEIERIESASERERCSKEVQDKDKPLKKRKQDSFPLEPGAGGTAGTTGAPGSGGGGGNAGKLTPQEASAAGNGASRPALMVSIDLQQAGSAPIPALEAQRWPEEPAEGPAAEGSDTAGVLRLKADGRPEVIKNRMDKHDSHREPSRHRHDGKQDRHPDTPKSSGRGEHGRDRDRDKERRHRNEDRRSPEERYRPDSPRVKQEGRGSGFDPSGRPRGDRPGFRSPGGGEAARNLPEGHRLQQPESKAGEFPAYLLGGAGSGALRNFVIPKVKWDKDGRPVDVAEGWGQPRVKLERLGVEGLVDHISKRPKPVVVLQKLSFDEVQRFIRYKDRHGSKSGKSRFSSGNKTTCGLDQSVLKDLPPELLAEIESTMPLCERVKMNKRKRSTVKEKPKYAEMDSDSDDNNWESAKKRQRKDRGDRAWDCESERERRGSGEHRRSGGKGFQEGRRGSGSRYRDSSDESPPPSMSDVARQMKKKEKQKKRKAYEPKLTHEELMDSSTFKRFSSSVDNVLENLEDVDFTQMDDDEIPQELLLGKQQLNELGSESAKIKAMGITCRIPSDKLVKVLNILEKNILDGAKLSTLMNHDNDEDEEKLWRDLIMERVTKSADACLTALNIMTSARMPKAVYIEDVIERVLQYTKFHLQNTLYPQYDPVYRVDPHGGGLMSSKAKRAKCSTHKQRVIVMLYNKVCDIVSNLSELLEIQLLTDTTILQISSMGITPFFVESVSELQLCAIKLVTAVFSRYEKHRQLILEEIFTSLARLPTSKRSLRNFRLNSCDQDGEPLYIQMVTALVLQLIQCVVHLPNDGDALEDEYDRKVDEDLLITNNYETAMRTAQNFLSVFLKKCGSKQGEEDYRPLFENFVQDLLSTVNKPEWPAAELLLSLLGRLLVHQFSNKQTEMALRVASLDYLGTVAARLRKDAVTSKMDQCSIDRILKEVTQGDDETQKLQKALLDYMEENTENDPSLLFARKFYIAQWFRDTTTEAEKAMKSRDRDEDSSDGPGHHAKDIESIGEVMQRAEARKNFLRKIIKTAPSQYTTLRMNSETVDYEDSCLIVRYLASMRPFAQSFDIYLTQILRVLGESAIAVRTKAMKCLSEVVAVDPSILARLDMQRGVHGRLMDNSTSVREAAVELLGRFVLSRPQLTEQYYDMLIERILDTGISVRKRVIKILRDICLEQPTFNKITEMCVRMIRRVNDEEGIKKLVNETFQKLWFTPTPAHDKETMTRKILNITDVVAACKDTGYDWFEQLLQNLLKSEEDAAYKPAKKACVQLVDNLVEHILKYEESLAENKGVNSTRLVSCITTLFLFSKIRAQLMVKHAMTMQPYLTTKCNVSDFMVICNVAKMLELVIPLMEHPSETFLTTIEEDLMKLIIKYGMTVVQHCVSCLGAVVNKVTHNYKFVWSCFNRYYGALTKLKTQHQEDPNSTSLAANKPALLRSLFTVGALCRHFEFDLEEFKGSTKVVIKERVLELLLYFTKHEDEEVQSKAIIGLGFLVIMHPSQMFVPEVKTLYNGILADRNTSVNLKIQILKNLQTYLQEEDSRMQEADQQWKKLSKQEDLKEMGDISSGMSSSIMQLYLKQVLEAFFHTQSSVRHFALNVIALTLNQGLIHPVQCVPYLIAMGTDPEPGMRNKADQQLVEIDKKYTGFIHMKAVAGMKMSYQVQQAIMASRKNIIRGFRQDETTSALCAHLYSMVRGNRQHRRAFLISLLNLFDDSSKTDVNMLLFIADNLACFPYQSQEEPLFIMHHIDITLSVSGSNLLQTFKESLLKEPRRREHKPQKEHSISEDEEEEVVRHPKKPRRPAAVEDPSSDSDLEDLDVEDVDRVMRRLPENATPLLDFANASQGILLLLVLKQHLKNLYGFSDSKIQKYSQTESAKVYDKAVNRKTNVHFKPRQTIDFLTNDWAHVVLTHDIKTRIVKQYLDFKTLMEHLDPDEEDEEGDAAQASANIRNKAINALLGGAGPGHGAGHLAPVEYDEEDESDGDERNPGSSRRSRRSGDLADPGNMNETVDSMDVIAIHCPKYKDRPQIARVIQKISTGYTVHWMAGSYTGPWADAKKRDGRKTVPWVDTIKESDIIYKKIPLTSNHKLSSKVAQTLRSLYAAKDGTSS
uniref:Nipped-B protein n=1 Tax=Esox lucius TaxID=8010 RepID=A0A6Q2XUS5_ESOLU